MKDKIIDESNPKKWRTEIPNILIKGSKSNISPGAKWLYVYLKSVAGENGKCWQSTKTLSEGVGFSAGKISSCKKELKKAGLIKIKKADIKKGHSDTIKIVDIWGQNFKEFENNYTPSNNEHPPSNNEPKKNPIKEEPYKEESDGKPSSSSDKIPTLQQVKAYFKENGYDPKIAEKAYNIYNASIEDHPKRKYWRDSRDNIIKNWKLKMQAVWFKDENEIRQQSQQMSYHNRL